MTQGKYGTGNTTILRKFAISMVDHNSEEKYLVRVRRAKPKKKYQREWNAPVEEWEREVCIFQQRVLFHGFNRKKLSVQADSVAGWAQHLFNTHLYKKSNHVEHQWSLFATKDIVFKVQRDYNNAQWMENLCCELIGNGFGYPWNYAQAGTCNLRYLLGSSKTMNQDM